MIIGIVAICLLVLSFALFAFGYDRWFLILDIISTAMLIIYSIIQYDLIYIIANSLILGFLIYRFSQDYLRIPKYEILKEKEDE